MCSLYMHGWFRRPHVLILLLCYLQLKLMHTKIRKNTTCTSTACSWLPPALKKVQYAPIREIDFTTPQKRRKSMECDLSVQSKCSCVGEEIKAATEDELVSLYKQLSGCKDMPSILSIVPGFNDPYIPYSESNTLPELLTSLFREDLFGGRS